MLCGRCVVSKCKLKAILSDSHCSYMPQTTSIHMVLRHDLNDYFIWHNSVETEKGECLQHEVKWACTLDLYMNLCEAWIITWLSLAAPVVYANKICIPCFKDITFKSSFNILSLNRFCHYWYIIHSCFSTSFFRRA